MTIIHQIFDYLWADEIFKAFLIHSQSMDNSLQSYCRYKLNLKSAPKKIFDELCNRLRANQISSIRLSDDENTPTQSNLFLKSFSTVNFIHLRSINVIEVQDLDWLCQLPNVHRLIIENSPMNSFIPNFNWAHLKHLSLSYCSYHQLRRIMAEAIRLISFAVGLIISDCSVIDYFSENYQTTLDQVTTLKLSIQSASKTN